MHEAVLPGRSRELLAALEQLNRPALAGWILAGGTGLALRIGHRVSEDFEFFRTDPMDVHRLHDVFGAVGPYETLQEADYTFTLLLHGTKLSFFRIRDPFLFKTTPYRFFQLADLRDIALMKLVAISGRGSRKDFVDLYFILRGGTSLEECFQWLPQRYAAGRANAYHILKSLTYFEDAEREPLPDVLEPLDWKECKAFFVREACAVVLP